MKEEKVVVGGGGTESTRALSSFVSVSGRQRFTVELRPGETTIVSWKKLVKDATKSEASIAAPQAPSNAHPALETRIAPGQPPQNEKTDAPPTNRFSSVIEKIERLYMGKHSSDEEDLNDVPDDDEYDTEDSFIDDAELDEYFQVENSAIKHDGFFVNRGKLERIEPPSLPNQQPKKRRKDLPKSQSEADNSHVRKQLKAGKKVAGKSVPLVGTNFSPLPVVAPSNVHYEDLNFQNQMHSTLICSKTKSAETKTMLDVALPSKVSEEKDVEKKKMGNVSSKYQSNKLKDGRLTNDVNELDQLVQRREKDGIHGRTDISVSEIKNPIQTVKAPVIQSREASSVRPKRSMLEKAIRELEKVVEESRPPAMEVQDADIAAQAVKRRLPWEVKLKLAKVARLAQASQGKISKELVNRLMSILGHLVQLRTLKRNLKIMVNMDLLAKREKDDRFQQMKKEIAEVIKLRVPYIKSKVLEQQAGSSDDFQEIGNEDKEVIKRKYSMDNMLEDKMCDLYDFYIEGLDEDAGPQARKLYAELAQLWPDGLMDNHGIKSAICRAKVRRRALYSGHKEKIKGKKIVARANEIVRAEASPAVQSQYTQEKLATDSLNNGLTPVSTPMPNATNTNTTVRVPSTSANGPSLDRRKHEMKGGSGNLNNTRTTETTIKKKVKRKPELELGEAHFWPEKLSSIPGEERHESNKQVASTLHKSSIQLAAARTNSEPPS